MTAALSITDSVRSAFPFSVDKFPLAGPEGLKTPHYGLFRSDNGSCVGVACRKGYQPHTVDDVCALVEAAQDAFHGDAVARCHFDEGHYVTVAPSKEYRQAIFGTQDNIFPRLIIHAGYDGRAFKSSLGLYRDACRNLMMIRSAGQAVTANIRHTYHLRDRLSELRETFSTLAARWNSVVETAQQMEATQVNLAEFLRAVYPLPNEATQRTRRTADRRVEMIVGRVIHERRVTGRPTVALGRDDLVSGWEAFNGVQGYVQHDMTRKGRLDEFGRAITALDDAAVTRAMELAIAV